MVVHQIAREKNSVTADLSKNKNISEKKNIITITRRKTVNKNRNECSYLKKGFGVNFATYPLCKGSSKLENSIQAVIVASGYK